MTPLVNNIEVQTINHLGIIAGIIDDMNSGDIIIKRSGRFDRCLNA